MPVYNAPLQPRGALVRVELSLVTALEVELLAAHEPVPSPVGGWGLIDTGASLTAVDEMSLVHLGVRPIGEASVRTAAGAATTSLYPARLHFPGSPLRAIEFRRVVGCALHAQGLLALIGRDVLRDCLMVYNGTAGTFSLAL